jgi:hypothetical protein
MVYRDPGYGTLTSLSCTKKRFKEGTNVIGNDTPTIPELVVSQHASGTVGAQEHRSQSLGAWWKTVSRRWGWHQLNAGRDSLGSCPLLRLLWS